MIETPVLERVQAPPQINIWKPPLERWSRSDPLPTPGQWTYEDWLRLPDDGFHYEVLNGELYMVPPPTIEHQRISLRLTVQMTIYATSRRLGEVLEAPCGVRLPGQPVPVQPDILFVRAKRLHILGREYVEGAPDLVVEVLSPGNWLYDRREKFLAYQQAGVAEYWIVDPRLDTIEVFVLEEGTFTLVSKCSGQDVAHSQVLTGFEVVVDDILAE